MKPKTLIPILTGLVIALGSALPQAQRATTASTEARPAQARAHLERLASEEFGGRQAGSEGERLAAEYLAAELARAGARPLPGRPTMFVPFEFTAGSRDGGSRLTISSSASADATRTFASMGEIQALSFSDNAQVTGPAVFAGYGLVVPESQDFGYDSYVGLDVKDKIVVVLRYSPQDAEPKTRALLSRYSDLRYKAMAARQRGAAALLVVTGPSSPNAGLTIPMSLDPALSGSGIPAASVSADVAAALFAGATSLSSAQKGLDTGNPHVAGFALPGVTVTLNTVLIREKQTSRNVVAYLPATSPLTGIEKPWVAVGAHYDHLGRGERGNSLAAAADVGRPHPGADDNASGSTAVLSIVETLSRLPRPRHLLVAFWSAEEVGLVGSSAFAAASPVPLTDIAAYLNYDMVGRMQDNKLTIQAVGTSSVWRSLLERVNVAAGFDVNIQDDPYQPTDVYTFNQANVPSLSFTTGAHADYHKPSDTADKINYEDLDRVSEMGAAIVGRLMALKDAPPFTRLEQSQQTATRADVRVTTGTIPDYTSSAKGLLLGGVVAGGPAEQAGLAKDDVIVEIAGQSITNIYDYTYALELLKAGEPAKVVYLRGGQRREAMLTPAARR